MPYNQITNPVCYCDMKYIGWTQLLTHQHSRSDAINETAKPAGKVHKGFEVQ